jgi:hypothetical protein
MRLPACLLLGVLLAPGAARAAADFTDGSLFRTAGVPAWHAGSGTFSIVLWVYAPDITGNADYFIADDGGPLAVFVNLGSAADSPTDPYFYTPNGEWHFNKDGTTVANPGQNFDVTLGWTYLAVSFTSGGATEMYAWQAGVNNDALVHIPAQAAFSTIGGRGSTNAFHIGNESGFTQGCVCYLGPVYVYDGIALTQGQVEAQRQQLAPVAPAHLIAFSTFVRADSLNADASGTAHWSTHRSVRYVASNPPVVTSGGGGGGGGSGGGALDLAGLLMAFGAARLRRRASRHTG